MRSRTGGGFVLKGLGVIVCGGALAMPSFGSAPFATSESGRFTLIGVGPENLFLQRIGVGPAINISGYELGANRAPVPASSDFLSNGSSGGPSLLFNVPSIPLTAALVNTGIHGNGNIAVTHPAGVFTMSETGIYGDLGILTAQPAQAADIGVGNSFFNDTNGYPNTFTSTGPTNPGVNNNTGGFGTFIPAQAANPATAIEQPIAAGVTGNVDFTALNAELANARSAILSLAPTQTLLAPDGVLSVDTTVVLSEGLNVIDIVSNGNDFVLNTMTLLIDGPANSTAIFRVPPDIKMSVSNSNLLVSNAGIGLNNVLFFSNRADNASHFEISNSIINGVAFWSLAEGGAGITVSSAQGCAQFVADRIDISGSRLCGCPFTPISVEDSCPGDVNGDRLVDLSDLAVLLGAFGTTAAESDLNGDGVVDLGDLALLLGAFGTICE